MAKLDTIDDADSISSLSLDDVVSVRRQLAEGQSLLRETIDRLRQSQEENEMHTRRRDELESRISALEAEYEELLGTHNLLCNDNIADYGHVTHLQRRRLTMRK